MSGCWRSVWVRSTPALRRCAMPHALGRPGPQHHSPIRWVSVSSSQSVPLQPPNNNNNNNAEDETEGGRDELQALVDILRKKPDNTQSTPQSDAAGLERALALAQGHEKGDKDSTALVHAAVAASEKRGTVIGVDQAVTLAIFLAKSGRLQTALRALSLVASKDARGRGWVLLMHSTLPKLLQQGEFTAAHKLLLPATHFGLAATSMDDVVRVVRRSDSSATLQPCLAAVAALVRAHLSLAVQSNPSCAVAMLSLLLALDCPLSTLETYPVIDKALSSEHVKEVHSLFSQIDLRHMQHQGDPSIVAPPFARFFSTAHINDLLLRAVDTSPALAANILQVADKQKLPVFDSTRSLVVRAGEQIALTVRTVAGGNAVQAVAPAPPVPRDKRSLARARPEAKLDTGMELGSAPSEMVRAFELKAKAGELTDQSDLLDAMRDVQPTRPDVAVWLFQLAVKHGRFFLSHDSTKAALQACKAAERVDWAMWVFNSYADALPTPAKRKSPFSSTFGTYCRVCLDTASPDVAGDMVFEAYDKHAPDSDKPTLLREMLTWFLDKRQFKDCLRVHAQMVEQHIKPHMSVYSDLIQAALRIHEVDIAHQLFVRMREVHSLAQADPKLANWLVVELSRRGRYLRSEQLIHELVRDNVQVMSRSMVSVLEGLLQKQQLPQAARLMRLAGGQDQKHLIVVLDLLAKRACTSGSYIAMRHALPELRKLPAANQRTMLGTLVTVCVQAKRPEMARWLVLELSAVASTNNINAIARGTRPKRGTLACLTKTLELFSTCKLEPDNGTVQGIAQTLAWVAKRDGDSAQFADQARQLLHQHVDGRLLAAIPKPNE